MHSRDLRRAVLAPASLLIAAACGSTPTDADHSALHREGTPVSPAVAARAAGLIKLVHNATEKYVSRERAGRDGYVIASPCVAHPTLGGMGFHWVNNALVDPVFQPLKPEAVLYGPDGKTLVAVEYIVINVGQPAPTFDGVPFDIGGTPVPVPHWSLHLWTFKNNPAGTFQPFNPAIVCD